MKEKTAIPDPIYKHDCDVCIYLGSYRLVIDYDFATAVAARRALAYFMDIRKYWEV